MPSTFNLVIGTIMGVSTLLMIYLSVKSRQGRLSNILMALGIVAEALGVFAQTKPLRITASIFGLALVGTSLILALRSLPAEGFFRRRA